MSTPAAAAEPQIDWKAKYEALRADYINFLEQIDVAGFQIQGFTKNKKAEITAPPRNPAPIPLNRAARRKLERQQEKQSKTT